jgi:hypothetical protein
LAVLAVLAATMAGCSHLPHVRMPWSHRPAPLPEVVHELEITDDAGAAEPFPQYWKRNTLVVDLQGVSGSGRAVLTPPAGRTWPYRLAIRVTPGAVGELDVRADQRWVVPIALAGAKPVDLELPPSLYTFRTSRISVAWAPAPQSPPGAR